MSVDSIDTLIDEQYIARQSLSGKRKEETPLERPDTLAGAVATHIRREILQGRLRANTRLTEVALGDRLEVSRTTVRDALRTLSDEGLVEIHRHRGATVSGLTPTVARETYELRRVLEAFAAREGLAGGPPAPDVLATIREAYERLQYTGAEGDIVVYGTAEMEFHKAISSLCGNGTLLKMLDGLQLRARGFIVYTNLAGIDLTEEALTHLPIVEALEAGDPDKLAEVVANHIQASGGRLFARLNELAG